MKRYVSLILCCMLVICGVFASGCQSAPPAENSSQEMTSQENSSGTPLRLCADLEFGGLYNIRKSQAALENFLRNVKWQGGPADVEVEFLPPDGTERQTELNRIRVELMAGSGPDLFITNCLRSDQYFIEEQALFQFPEQAMKRGLFLKLDDYIENAQFMEWDKLTPAVMDAGKTEKGQFLLPLAFSFPVSIFLASDVKPYPADTTWADAVKETDPVLGTSMEPILEPMAFDPPFTIFDGPDYLSYTWKELADYNRDKLLISEEELLQRAKEAVSLEENSQTSLPHFRGVIDRYIFERSLDSFEPMREERMGIAAADELTMIPLYCDQGGAVVPIRAFAGINAATERPEDAFFVLDLLLSEETQKDYGLYEGWTFCGMPVHGEIAINMPETVWAAYEEARSHIVSARFPTPLDSAIVSIVDEYDMLKHDGKGTDEDLSELVSKAYGKMKQTLEES